jgi:hypothetical protein
MLTPPLPHACFFYFSDTCSLGSNGSTKFLESMLPLIPFRRAAPALVLECYDLCAFGTISKIKALIFSLMEYKNAKHFVPPTVLYMPQCHGHG